MVNEDTLFPPTSSVAPLWLDRLPEVVRISKTGMTSSRRCSAFLRARASGEGGGGRVAWWSCFAWIRSRREELRLCTAFGRADGAEEVVFRGEAAESWARITPAFKSVRRLWPLARRGDIFEREAQTEMGASGRVAMNAGMSVEDWCCQKWWILDSNWSLSFSTSTGCRRNLVSGKYSESSTQILPLP